MIQIHFTDSQYENFNRDGKLHLRHDAVPTLLLQLPKLPLEVIRQNEIIVNTTSSATIIIDDDDDDVIKIPSKTNCNVVRRECSSKERKAHHLDHSYSAVLLPGLVSSFKNPQCTDDFDCISIKFHV